MTVSPTKFSCVTWWAVVVNDRETEYKIVGDSDGLLLEKLLDMGYSPSYSRGYEYE